MSEEHSNNNQHSNEHGGYRSHNGYRGNSGRSGGGSRGGSHGNGGGYRGKSGSRAGAARGNGGYRGRNDSDGRRNEYGEHRQGDDRRQHSDRPYRGGSNRSGNGDDRRSDNRSGNRQGGRRYNDDRRQDRRDDNRGNRRYDDRRDNNRGGKRYDDRRDNDRSRDYNRETRRYGDNRPSNRGKSWGDDRGNRGRSNDGYRGRNDNRNDNRGGRGGSYGHDERRRGDNRPNNNRGNRPDKRENRDAFRPKDVDVSSKRPVYDPATDAKPKKAAEAAPKQEGWTPNKNRKVRSKKAFDQQNLQNLVNQDEATPYKGQLDPMREERSTRVMGRISRDTKRYAEKKEKEERKAERAARAKLEDDGGISFEDKFEPSKASPARLAALDVTRTVRRRNAYAQELVEKRIENNSYLSGADRAFATLLVLGVVSTWGTLDDIINRGLKDPDDISPDVRDALRISTYEIIILGKQPHAAVDQGVELVRSVVPSASGLGNAVLHRILNMRETFPFGDPEHDVAALARFYAFPEWLARQLIEDQGAKAASDLMRVSNDPAPLFIYVNAIKATDDEVKAVFEEAGAQLAPASAADITPDGCFHVSNPRVLANEKVRALFDEGKILVSDAAAQVVASSLLPDEKPTSFLEIGAGRGTKTIMLQGDAQRKYGSQMNMTSMDNHAFKTQVLADRVETYGVELADIVTGNATRMEGVLPDKQFDVVFIDAPCSGLGTLRRHQEIRWRVTPAHIAELADGALAMLRSASQNVAPGGQLVYATCTVTYAENNGVVKRFLESEEGKQFKLAPIAGRPCIASQITSGSADAHFCARFVRADQ